MLPSFDLFFNDLSRQANLLALQLLAQDAAPPEADSFLRRFLENPLLLPIGVVAIFYVTYFGPERRRRAEEAKMMASLGKNDRVVTVGGIHGTIVNASPDSDTVTLKIDENGSTRIKVNRSAIVKIVGEPKNKPDNDSSA
ncbi:preprotein translocase subunit YajC [Rhodopirellula sp. JC740]|uniref:Sec translocon accessory complex subunit YajC n=1 Tax=Rhodopirellula halodulae TaxID=2894198 RepID=A0ABS8NN45_9BACT|nr:MULTISPECIES: preprotein translocase subunit YajC [unclassified Rhodopirellula]MCC9644799.1 preprotein translocase subunit YajC [Rhodopirellula sp. JC740]MCC9658572.1 preprotein translocase subunit YajC [Rhodopirellula sp. JC737]